MDTMLTLPQVRDVCLNFQGADQCRYLSYDDQTGVQICLKKVQAKKDIIDQQVKKFIEKAKANGQDPRQMGRALGDNCKGYPPLKTKKQGYDIPGS
jgi:hypothetical protein